MLGESRAKHAQGLHIDAAAPREFHRLWSGLCSTGGHALFLASFWSLVRGPSGQQGDKTFASLVHEVPTTVDDLIETPSKQNSENNIITQDKLNTITDFSK